MTLTRGPAAAEVVRPGFEQITVARRHQPGRHGSATVLPVRQDLVRRPVHRKVGKVAQTWPKGVLHIDLVAADQVGKSPTNARHRMGVWWVEVVCFTGLPASSSTGAHSRRPPSTHSAPTRVALWSHVTPS
jgi:hypothetical protein